MNGNQKFILTLVLCLASAVTWAGMRGMYYESDSPGAFTTLVGSQWDFTIDFNWQDGEPQVVGRSTLFAIRWEGQLQIEQAGTYRFYTVTDDGVRLYINDQLVIDAWVDQGATEHSGEIYLDAGAQDIKLEYYEHGGFAMCRLLWSGPGIPKQVIPPTAFVPVEQGFTAAMFDHTNPLAADPVYVLTVPEIAFNWQTRGPAVGMPVDYFSIRFRASFEAPGTGEYTFIVASDDGADLYIDDNLIVNYFGVGQAITERVGTIELEQGQTYQVDLRYAEHAGNASCYLYWEGPGIEGRQLMTGDSVALATILQVYPADGPDGVLSRHVEQGTDVVFSVNIVDPADEPEITWYFLPLGYNTPQPFAAEGKETDTITLPGVTMSAAGYYWCTVSDGVDVVESPRFLLRVYDTLPVSNSIALMLLALACMLPAVWILRGNPVRK